jgi:hypothetical protein
MPDNEHFTVKDFLNNAPFPTELLQRPDTPEHAELPGGIARIDLTDWQVDVIAQAMEVALEQSQEYDRTVVFAEDPDGGHMSLSTLLAQKFHAYFSTLADVLEALEEHVDGQHESAAS